MHIKKFVQVLIFIGFIASTHSQGTQNIVPTIPTSPQAAAFLKYGDHNINYATGIPNIDIPLFAVNHHRYEIPVSLKYNPQPLKPGYNYDVFGQGWSLSINSCISRTIEGTPDELRNFQIEYTKLADYYFNPPSNAIIPPYNHVDLATINTAFDKFSAVLPDGTSFDFIIDGNNIKVSEGRQVKITYTNTTSNINSFTIIDEKGIKYSFNEGDSPRPGSASYQNYVSWKLSQIDLPDTPEPIVFNYNYTIQSPYDSACGESGIKIEYGTEIVQNEPTGSGPIYISIANSSDYPSYSGTSYKMKLLSSISYGNTEIYFDFKDSNTLSSYNYVEKIRMKYNSAIIKQIELKESIYTIYSLCMQTPVAKLDKIAITGSNSLDKPLTYQMDYKYSDYHFFGTDHWGYLNARDTSYDVANFNLFVPIDYINQFPDFLVHSRISAVNKSTQDINPYYKIKLCQVPNDIRLPGTANEHGILSKIKYPTGGYTEFEFENHRYLSSINSDGDYIPEIANRQSANAAGFRIKKIVDYVSEGKISQSKNFEYGTLTSEFSHTGLGVAALEPNILTYMTYSEYNLHTYNDDPKFIRNMVLGFDPNGIHTSFLDPFKVNALYYQNVEHWKWQCVFSPENFRKVLGGRPAVLYPFTTVYYGNIEDNGIFTPNTTVGKTTYSYDITQPGYDLMGKWMDNIFFEAPYYNGTTIVYLQNSVFYNNLKEKIDYKLNDNHFYPVKNINYTYTTEAVSVANFIYNNPIPMPLSGGYFKSYIQNNNFFTNTSYNLWLSRISSEYETSYFENGNSLSTSKDYFYNGRKQLIKTRTSNSRSEIVEENFKYPELEISGGTTSIIQNMVNKNIISPVIESTTKKSELPSTSADKIINGFKINYFEFPTTNASIIKPFESFDLEIIPSGNIYTLKDKITKYSANGNPLEYLSKNTIYSSYEYGYSDQYMVVKAENVNQATLSSAINASLPAGFSNLESLLNSFTIPNGNWRIFNTNLRNNLPANSFVTTYTYDPLIGVTSITDPKGDTITYTYDSFGRLQNVKDKDGNILSENEYHYKN